MLLLESLLDGLLSILTLRSTFLQSLFADNSLQVVELKGVTSGHDVVVVDKLNERLDLVSLSSLLLVVLLGDGLGVLLNTSNKGVSERMRL